MNHGKTSNLNRLDLDALNEKIARILGKRTANSNQNNQFKKKPINPNLKFGGLFFTVLLILWLLTGIYYVGKGQTGILLRQGKVVKVVSGIKVGLDYPYPFSTIELMFTDVHNSSIGRDNSYRLFNLESHNYYQVGVDFSYFIKDPLLFFNNYYQENGHLDQKVQGRIEAGLQNYFMRSGSNVNNTIVLANYLRDKVNNEIEIYGLYLNRLELVKYNKMEESKLLTKSGSKLGTQILQEAKTYQAMSQAKLADFSDNFNRLVVEYQKNPAVTAELAYYQILSKLPESNEVESYPLLNSSLAEFLGLESREVVNNQQLDLPRNLNRQVKRERVFVR